MAQEGYNVDLLDDGTPKVGSATPETQHAPLASNHGHAEAGLSKEALPSYATAPVPWWRTKKFIIFAVIFAVAAIAAIVGGAVGGTVNHHKGSNNDAASTTASTTSSAAAPDTSGDNPGISQGGGTSGNTGDQSGNNSAAPQSSATTTSATPINQGMANNVAQATKVPSVGISGEVD